MLVSNCTLGSITIVNTPLLGYKKAMFDLSDYIRQHTAQVDAFLDHRIPSVATHPATLHQAMRYSVFAGGKRFRPLLCMAAAEACGGSAEQALTAGAALELLHTYTLIHDDLPAMDNDDFRRGQPTCHRKYDEATAILAGDALLTLAFEVLVESPCSGPWTHGDLVRELAQAGGSEGVIGGQMEDIAQEGKDLSEESLLYIHRHKTGRLIEAAVRLGAMTTGAERSHVQSITEAGSRIGLAFQIADDLLNATGNAKKMGKAIGTDQARGKQTFVALYGIEVSREKAESLIGESRELISSLPGHHDPLSALATFTISRDL